LFIQEERKNTRDDAIERKKKREAFSFSPKSITRELSSAKVFFNLVNTLALRL